MTYTQTPQINRSNWYNDVGEECSASSRAVYENANGHAADCDEYFLADLSETKMSNIENVFEYFNSEIKIKCASASIDTNEIRIVEVDNVFEKPLQKEFLGTTTSISDSHRNLLNIHNGMTLFFKEYEIDDYVQEVGIRLYSYAEIEEHTKGLQSLILEKIPDYLNTSDQEDLESWLKGLVAIGEPLNSSDKYVVNYSQSSVDSDQVLFLDHECFYGDALNSSIVDVIASGVVNLLEEIAKDPIKFLGANWRHYEGYMSQWYPVEVLAN